MSGVQPAPADLAHMDAALALARRGLGRVAPNPAVGCLIVAGQGADSLVVGRGWTQPGGRPHAETEALRRAGTRARMATAFVTLEPCDHHGQTPPCTEALLRAGIGRVVIACEDPDPRVSGRGIRRLRRAGLDVVVGIRAEEARALNRGFILRVTEGRPMVTLKLATTLDGRIATHRGESRWITGEVARSWGHGLRARHDAIMVGVNTALADDPELTCRLPGLIDRSPVRIVVDSRLRLPLTSRLVEGARAVPTWLVTLRGAERARMRALEDCGITVIEVDADDRGVLDIRAACQSLAGRGITRLLVEGGAHLAASLLEQQLVDCVEWFRAARIIGGDGLAAVVGFGVDRLSEAVGFRRTASRNAGEDVLESYVRLPRSAQG